MNIKEAIKLLNRIDIKSFLTVSIEQSNYIVDKADEVNTAIETVLNELERKDKVINLMANRLTTDYHDTEWVKEYFYKLAEEILTKKKQSDIM